MGSELKTEFLEPTYIEWNHNTNKQKETFHQ